MNLRVFHFVERVGARVLRTGQISAPSAKGILKSAPDAVLEFVAPAMASVALPAYWTATKGAVTLPPQPSPYHQFDYAALAWVLDDGQAWAAARAERDRLLAASDWRVARAMEAGEPVPAPWVAYRQALRDITDQADPLAIDWPTPPT